MHIQHVINNFNNTSSTHNLISGNYNYDHMVYVRLFEGCNLHCEHCFIPSNPKKIESSFYDNCNLTQELINHGRVAPESRLYIQWHGGEPTLLGVEYLENAIEKVQSDKRFMYMHGIQTNLMNFHQQTDKWVELYKNYFDSHLGISWDFSIRHTKINSLSAQETNEQFEKQFWKNVELAQTRGLELYMVVTATKSLFKHFKNPFDFYEMMAEKGITKLNFERITKTGYARNSWEKLGLSNAEYSHYMSKFFKAYILFKDNNPETSLSISPFDGLLASVVGMVTKENILKSNQANIWDILSHKNQGYGCWSGECDTRFHTIDSNGYKQGCTALTSEEDNKNKVLKATIEPQKIMWIKKKSPNINEIHANNIHNDENEVKLDSISDNHLINTRHTRQEACVQCEFLSICSSGCLSVEKFDDSLECSGAKGLFKTIHTSVKNIIELKDKSQQLTEKAA